MKKMFLNTEKLNKDEKRRLLLNKKYEKNAQANEETFARPNESAHFLRIGRGGAVARTPLSKRMLAIILAIVFVLTVVPTAVFVGLRGRASGITGLDPVTMNVRVNGADLNDTALINAGIIRENVADAQLTTAIPEECFYVKALMVDSTNNTETEISSVGAIDNKVYYSIDEDTNTGTLLDTRTQQLVLVYAAKYSVTIEESEHGDIDTNALKDDDNNLFVWGGESLRVQVVPDTDYKVNNVSYHMGGISKTAKTTNGNAVISNVSGDVVIHDPISAIEGYQIINLTSIKNSSTHGNGNLAEDLGQDTYTVAADQYVGYKYEYAFYKSSYPPEPIAPNTTDTFYLYSDSNSGGSEYLLNMFRINGEEFPVEQLTEEVGSSITKTLDDGTVVTVRMHGWNQGLFWLDNKPNASTDLGHDWDIAFDWDGRIFADHYTYTAHKRNGQYDWQKKRTVYEIEVQNPHSDLNVEYNFKQKNSREMIIKGLRGIEETAASAEERGADRYLSFDLFNQTISISDNYSLGSIGVETRNYTLNKSNVNIYPAYYKEQYDLGWSFIPSSNLYLYRVKEGYNPYSVANNVEAHYYNSDGTEVSTSQYGILASETAERPDDAIVSATKAAGDVAAEAAEAMGLDTSNELIMSFLEGLYSFNNYLRNWGGFNGANDELKNKNLTTARKHLSTDYHNLLLTDIAAEEAADPNKTWYAIALLENEAYNQQMIMNADPYNYYLRLDLGEGGSLANASERFDQSGTILTEKESKKHTIEDKQAFILLPENEPTNTNHGVIFEGWRLVDSEGNAIKDANNEDIVYQSLSQINLSGDTLKYAFGKDEGSDREADQVIKLEAIWTDIKHADVTTILVEAWYEVPADYTAQDGEVVEEKTLNDVTKKYLRHYRTTEIQAANEETALLNQHEPDNEDYYVRNPASVVKSTTSRQDTIDVIPEENQFLVYYDIAYETVSITKRVLGNPKALKNGFEITATLTREDDNSPVLNAQEAASVISLSDGGTITVTDSTTLTYTKTYFRGDTLTIDNVPYGWTITVSEPKATPDSETGKVDYTTSITSYPETAGAQTSEDSDPATTWEGIITEDTTIDVNNKSDSYLQMDKQLSRNAQGTYDVTLEAYATGDITSEKITERIPTDFVLVLDQSGSMSFRDMATGYKEATKTRWTISDISDSESETGYYYREVDGNGKEHYYRVYKERGYLYEYMAPNTVYVKDTIDAGGLSWFQGEENETKDLLGQYYFRPSDGLTEQPNSSSDTTFYPVTVTAKGAALYYQLRYKYQAKNGAEYILRAPDKPYYYNLTAGEQVAPDGRFYTSPLHFTWTAYSVVNTAVQAWTGSNHEFYCYAQVLGFDTGMYIQQTLYKRHSDYSKLCFTDDDGVQHTLIDATFCDSSGKALGGKTEIDEKTPGANTNTTDAYWDGTLYEADGKETRLESLNTALKQFVAGVSEQTDYFGKVENRVAIVGFSSENSSDYTYNNTELLTGVDVDRTQDMPTGGNALSLDGKRHDGPQYDPSRGDDGGLSSTLYANTLLDVTDEENISDVVRDNNGIVTGGSGKLFDAIDDVTAYGGTKPAYGLKMAEQIFANRGETSEYEKKSSGDKAKRNTVVIFFTDGRPGNYDTVDQYNEANAVVAAAYDVKKQKDTDQTPLNTTIYSIGVFGESDGNPLTYPKAFYQGEASTNQATAQNNANVMTEADYDPALVRTAIELDVDASNAARKYIYRKNYYARDCIAGTYGYPDNPDDTIGYYMRTVSSEYPDAEKFSEHPSDNELYTSMISRVRKEAGDNKYYYMASDHDTLLDVFAKVSETEFEEVSASTTGMNGTTALLRDVINGDDFVIDPEHPGEGLTVTVYTQNGDQENQPPNNDPAYGIDFHNNPKVDVTSDVNYEWKVDNNGNVYLDVSGFDYGANFIAFGKPANSNENTGPNEGKKIIVEISGLVPKKDATGKLESNKDDSGIYKMIATDNPETPFTFVMQDAFDVPSMYRYRYNLLETGAKTTDTFDVELTRNGAEGIVAVYDGEERSAEMLTGDTYSWNNVPNGRAIYLESFNESTSLTANVVLDEVTEVGSLKNTDIYHYTLTLEETDVSTPEQFSVDFATHAENSTFHIRNTSNYRSVLITEETRGVENEADFSDQTHEFPMQIHYMKDANTPFTGTVIATIRRASDPSEARTAELSFGSDGWSRNDFALASGDTIEFDALDGYTLTVYEDSDDAGNYAVSYEETDGDDEDGQTKTIAIDNQYKVVNTLKANPVVTGFKDGHTSVSNIFFALAGVVALGAGAWFAIQYKRRKENELAEYLAKQ